VICTYKYLDMAGYDERRAITEYIRLDLTNCHFVSVAIDLKGLVGLIH